MHLLKTTFRWWGQELAGVTMDLSAGGAFISCNDVPQIGARLTLWFEPIPGEPKIEFRGHVVRALPSGPARSTPGFAVEWTQARTAGTTDQLRAFLQQTFGVEVTVRLLGDGRAGWEPEHIQPNTRKESKPVTRVLTVSTDADAATGRRNVVFASPDRESRVRVRARN